jgi:amidase
VHRAVSEVQPHEVEIMRQRRADIMVRLDALLADNAVFVLPTVPDLAPLLRLRPADPVAFRERALALLCIAGLGGLPKVTLPFGTLHGRPIGPSLFAARERCNVAGPCRTAGGTVAGQTTSRHGRAKRSRSSTSAVGAR